MRILLVDDDMASNNVMANYLRGAGHEVRSAYSGEEALQVIAEQDFDLMLTDHRMPGMSGVQLIEEAQKHTGNEFLDIVVLTAYAQIDVAVAAMKAGAFDYLDKPLHLEELLLVMEKVEQHQRLIKQHFELSHHFNEKVAQAVEETRQELDAWKKAHYEITGLGSMGIFSPAMRHLIKQADILHQRRDMSVLLQGETGTGKELMARYIHYGPFPEAVNAPFVAINCANLNQLLLESELFGYEAGAFTGGLPKGQIGKVDLAEGGTLFLDEINSLSLESQAKILRLIEERQFYRVGGNRLIKTDVRIIAASNADLVKLIETSQFRADLYYRLGMAQLNVLPLRERREDILPMAAMFLEQSRGNRTTDQTLSDRAQQALLNYSWPGNCRELRNIITYAAMIQPQGVVDLEHLGPLLQQPAVIHDIALNKLSAASHPLPSFQLTSEAFDLQEYLNQLTTKIILDALKMHKGNRTQTAEYLGLSRSALYRRMHELDI